MKIRGRRVSRKFEAAKESAGFGRKACLPKGTRLPVSKNRGKAAMRLARAHAKVANIRKDFTHKLVTKICRENQTVVIEDLHVAGMMKNERLALAISDIGFGEIRRQFEYKSVRYGTSLIVASRWYASSKTCSVCGHKNTELKLGDREWECPNCHAHLDRDINAAINLMRLATGETALPVANRLATACTAQGNKPGAGGKVTTVSYESVSKTARGRNRMGMHICTHS